MTKLHEAVLFLCAAAAFGHYGFQCSECWCIILAVIHFILYGIELFKGEGAN